MSNQYLEAVISELSARVTQQSAQIEELQKQLIDMQAAMSCDGPYDGEFRGVVSI
ncbi:hypothetical protein [Providencia stuartii]|uniref:hypothetical protein n=1 Tax=Providencia stuartii TaxID=588 RepID=UPI00300C2AFE